MSCVCKRDTTRTIIVIEKSPKSIQDEKIVLSSKVLLFNSHHPKLKTKFLEAQETFCVEHLNKKSTLAEKLEYAVIL